MGKTKMSSIYLRVRILIFCLYTGLIYWTDTGERKIKRANKEGKQNETVIERGLHTADGIAIDSAGRKVTTPLVVLNVV